MVHYSNELVQEYTFPDSQMQIISNKLVLIFSNYA